jgi:hypothetical protein
MTAQDDLRYLIDVTYPQIVDNYNIILSKLNDERAAVVAEIITINDAVLDGAETAHLAALEAKRAANGWWYVKTFGNYGTENLTDWEIYGASGVVITTPQLQYTSANSFTCQPGVSFAVGTPVLIQPGNIIRLVQSVTWFPNPPPGPPPPTHTVIGLGPGTAIPPGLSSVEKSIVVYSPTVNWDSDPTIEPHQDAFATGYNHLTQEPGLSGTYGLIPRRDQIDTGIGLQTLNRDAYQSFIDDYEPYAAP